MHSVRENILRPVSESIGRLPRNDAHLQKIGEIAVKGDLTEAYHHTNPRQSLNLLGKMGSAVANLLGEGFISRRCAADDRGYPRVAELEAVVAGDACRLAGEA